MNESMNVFNKEDTEQIIDMYKSGISIDEIIGYFDTKERYIRIVLKEYNVDRQRYKRSDELISRVIKLYNDGLSQIKISKIVVLSETTIHNILVDANIEIRSQKHTSRRYRINRDSYYFDQIDSQNKAYILGLLFADGCNCEKRHTVSIALQEGDGYLLEQIQKELKHEGKLHFIPLHEKNERHKNQFRLCVIDEYMSKKLAELGMVSNKSLILKFPTCVPMKFIRHFIRGYFDGDGSVFLSKINKPSAMIVGTYEFCSSVKRILDAMNCCCSIQHPKQSGDHNTYVLRLCGYNSVSNFMSWIYEDADLYLQRKFEEYQKIVKAFTAA